MTHTQTHTQQPAVGDWIRFMRGGRLVIDEVAYIVPRHRRDSTPEAMTVANGQVGFEDIIELRRGGPR